MKQQKSRKGTRIIKRRTPTGKTSISYVKEKPKQATCARCEAKLQGVPRAVPSKLGKMTKSKRSVSRKFGGVLCGTCVKEAEKYKTRMESGYIVKRDLTLEKYLPKGWFASLKKAEKKEVKEEKPKAEKKEKKPAKKTAKKTAKKAAKKTAKKTAKKAGKK